MSVFVHLPVNWIVDIGEDVEKLYGVKFPKTVPYSIHDSEHNMQAEKEDDI